VKAAIILGLGRTACWVRLSGGHNAISASHLAASGSQGLQFALSDPGAESRDRLLGQTSTSGNNTNCRGWLPRSAQTLLLPSSSYVSEHAVLGWGVLNAVRYVSDIHGHHHPITSWLSWQPASSLASRLSLLGSSSLALLLLSGSAHMTLWPARWPSCHSSSKWRRVCKRLAGALVATLQVEGLGFGREEALSPILRPASLGVPLCHSSKQVEEVHCEGWHSVELHSFTFHDSTRLQNSEHTYRS
jgi:hypothetical protein